MHKSNDRFRLALCYTAVATLTLALIDFPEAALALLPSHGPNEHPPLSLVSIVRKYMLGSDPWFGSKIDGLLGLTVAWFLFAAPPISIALLIKESQQTPQAGLGKMVAGTALVGYVLYYSGTYHSGLLLLAMLAWAMAALHTGEIAQVSERLRDQIDSLKELARLNLREFYTSFYSSVENAKSEILSVERRWSGEKAVWSAIQNPSSDRFEDTLAAIRKKSGLYRALMKTNAKTCTFIGPMPWRDSEKGYTGDQFLQLLSLVHTMCVCELVRRDRMGPDCTPIRVKVVIADVPDWVKIVDNEYWLLQGSSQGTVWSQRFVPPEEDIQRLVEQHRAQITAHARIATMYVRNARGAHEHISSLLLESAARLKTPFNEALKPQLGDLVNSIRGNLGLEELLHRNSKQHQITAQHLLHLFQLFVAVYFAETSNALDAKSLDKALGRVTIRQLWERLA